MTGLYKPKRGHGVTKAGTSDLAGFFAWALRLCKRDEVDRVMVETPDWRITWDAPKKKKRAAKAKRKHGAK